MCIACAKCGVPPKNWPKLYYVINSVFFMLISLGLLYSLKSSAEEWDWFECLDPSDEEVFNASSCYGIKAVLAMSFTLFIYHFIIFCLILPRMRFSMHVHDGYWGAKLIVIILLYIAAFFIPHKFYVIWAHICRGGSFLFLIVQGYFLLNASYTWNDRLLAAH
jgi:hypothetical protein